MELNRINLFIYSYSFSVFVEGADIQQISFSMSFFSTFFYLFIITYSRSSFIWNVDFWAAINPLIK